ncbi:hypothetical protein K488DRAFT_77201 [Vararia minispora EC-137]|uniref:Uncharacterized protein n=1 Tax=Vararia minispora EC-137 TaxID=1314806 RepID=A0ACB8QS52_9AGAM|nr:hypothetical protein K488DRAFT_77201 [Vararia minispora EC-137]
MAPTETRKTGSSTKAPTVKKEKIFHPNSRKADQLNRKENRKSKLAEQAVNRTKKQASFVDFFGFFYHALPPDESVLTLDDLHSLIRDVWLTRNDAEIAAEQAARRKGRPKSVKQQKLEELKLRETEEYRTGMEVPDLTHTANVALMRQWDEADFSFTQILRFIRVTSVKPDLFLVTRPGKHHALLEKQSGDNHPAPGDDAPMLMDPVEDRDVPLAEEPLSRFASTIVGMDGPS